jgi:hypothetical protein
MRVPSSSSSTEGPPPQVPSTARAMCTFETVGRSGLKWNSGSRVISSGDTVAYSRVRYGCASSIACASRSGVMMRISSSAAKAAPSTGVSASAGMYRLRLE